MIISITSSKGGAGKTTLNAILGANLFSYFKKKVAFLDIDPQQTLTRVRKKEIEELKTIGVNSKMYQTAKRNLDVMGKPYSYMESLNPVTVPFQDIKKRIDELKSTYDVVILDFPGSLNINKNTLNLIYLLDYIFVPFYPDKNSFESTYPFFKTLSLMKDDKKIKATSYAFFNKYTTGKGANAGQFARLEKFFEAQKINCLKNNVFNSISLEDYSTITPIGNTLAYNWTEEIAFILNSN